MRRIDPKQTPLTAGVVALALLFATAPANAQTAEDPNTATDTTAGESTEGETTGGETTGAESEGNFSRNIPEGLKATLTEDEINDYQTQLDAAETPQERNTIRRELQRLSRERHVESVQGEKAKSKGLFGNMVSDFKDIISGKAAKDAKDRAASGKSGGKSGDKGSKGGHGGKGGNSGGKGGGGGNGGGGGGGGGRNK